MVIGIEAERANTKQKTGVEHYAKQIILHLAKIDTTNSYILYLRTQPEDWFLSLPKNFRIKVMPFPIFWTQIRISWEMLIRPVDVLFIPASSIPLIHPKKTVVTVHDLAFMLFPETYTWFARNFHKFEDFLVKIFTWKIIAVSQATKNDLVKFYNLDPSKISVVHHGFSYEDGKSNPGAAASLKQLPVRPYVVFLSTLQPRKNLEGLIKAFRQLKNDLPELEHKLVVVGRPGWKFEKILQVIESNKDFVMYYNNVSDEDRFVILKQADLLVQPAFYEGFGMQTLEAIAAGVPVAVSNVSSLPEVAGEAAVYFDPKDTKDMARAIKSVLLDKSLSDRLKILGKKRLEQFSWEKCARETLDVLTGKSG